MVLLIIGVTLLLTAHLIKEPYDLQSYINFQLNNIAIPASYYVINLFGLKISINTVIIICMFIISASLYLLLYKNDDEIKAVVITLKDKISTSSRASGEKRKSYEYLISFLFILIAVIVVIYCAINYYQFIQNLQRPLTWGESLFIGFSKIFLIVAVIATVLGIIKSVLTTKP